MRTAILALGLVWALASGQVWSGEVPGDVRLPGRLETNDQETGEDTGKEKGVLQGVVSDKGNGETLPFAAVQIEGTAQGVVTGMDGSYTMNLDPGTYKIKVSFTSYKDYVAEVRIVPGQSTHLDVALESFATELEEVKVTAKRLRHTDAAVVSTMKQADVVATECYNLQGQKLGSEPLTGLYIKTFIVQLANKISNMPNLVTFKVFGKMPLLKQVKCIK